MRCALLEPPPLTRLSRCARPADLSPWERLSSLHVHLSVHAEHGCAMTGEVDAACEACEAWEACAAGEGLEG